MTALTVSTVGKRFDDGETSRWVLEAVSFTVESGRTVALWGPSGSGKSTLLKVMAGILLPDAGSVRFDDDNGATFDVSGAPERQRVRFRRRQLGFVFQFFNLVPTLTVAENVLLPLELNRRELAGAAKDRHDAALARLDELGVGHCAARFPETLSGGEHQRVAIARALAHAPPIVLADEPTGNLDRDNAAIVTEALIGAASQAGCGLVVATHNERIAARADSLIKLD